MHAAQSFKPTARIRSNIVLAVAIALCVFHVPGTANESVVTVAASQVKESRKKPATKAKAPVLKKGSAKKPPPPKEDPAAIAASLERYKKELAQKISEVDPAKVYDVQPQALLRSVVVIRFAVDRNGKLLSSAIQRSNGDPLTEATALASLRGAAPLPKPPAGTLTNGRLELMETWLFNSDGRFQVRSIAQVQKSE